MRLVVKISKEQEIMSINNVVVKGSILKKCFIINSQQYWKRNSPKLEWEF